MKETNVLHRTARMFYATGRVFSRLGWRWDQRKILTQMDMQEELNAMAEMPVVSHGFQTEYKKIMEGGSCHEVPSTTVGVPKVPKIKARNIPVSVWRVDRIEDLRRGIVIQAADRFTKNSA